MKDTSVLMLLYEIYKLDLEEEGGSFLPPEIFAKIVYKLKGAGFI